MDVKGTGSSPSIHYVAKSVIGRGSFGIVYKAQVVETGEIVAIKKVLQDRRFKNRELQILTKLRHPTVVRLSHSFFSKGENPDDVYLNLVMEHIQDTIYRTLRNHTKARKLVPLILTKTYIYQVCRALAYIHSHKICHRDIKPHNLLLDNQTHNVRLCDFGSAKILTKGESNVAYICSRYYRAPELVFEATEYTTQIDIWSLGCVLAELLLGEPLFPGESGVDQLIEIIKIMGSPTHEQIIAMNPNHTPLKFPMINPHPWSRVFRNKASSEAIHLVSSFLRYNPKERLDAFDALAHPFFDELRRPESILPGNVPIPNMYNFTKDEFKRMDDRGLRDFLVPPHAREEVTQLEHQCQYTRSPTLHKSQSVLSMSSGSSPSSAMLNGSYSPMRPVHTPDSGAYMNPGSMEDLVSPGLSAMVRDADYEKMSF